MRGIVIRAAKRNRSSRRGSKRLFDLLVVAAVILAAAVVLVAWGEAPPALARPVLLVAYRTNPASVSPGDRFDLEITVKNDGDTSAKNLLVSLGLTPSTPSQGAAGEAAPSGVPISLLDTGSVALVGTVQPDESETTVFHLAADGRALSGAYNLAVRLQHDGGQVEQVIGLVLVRRPRIDIVTIDYPGEVTAGKSFKVSAEIANVGSFKANGVSVRLTSPDLDIGEGTLFVGELEPGDADTFEARVTASDPGRKTATLTLTYLDDFNREGKLTRDIVFRVAKVEPGPSGGEGAGFWARIWGFIRALFGVGEA